MRIEKRLVGDVLVLAIRERRLDVRSAAAFKDQMEAFVSGGAEWIVLDLSDVEFMDSSGLGAVVSSLKQLGQKGDIAIAASREAVTALFTLTRMDKVFRMFPTVDAAQQALAASR
jgi:anti-sigma B factor antagonist